MAKRFHGSYEGVSDRHATEASDGSMIPSGQGSFANMPQGVVMREYPKAGSYMPENLDDSIRGIDGQVGADTSKRNAHLHPKKI